MKALWWFLRMRPFLWLLGLVVAALLVSLTWEQGTSYDDGGLGTWSFLILYTVGLPVLASGQLLRLLIPTSAMWAGYLIWALQIAIGLGFFIWLDRIAERWRARHSLGIRAETQQPR